MGKTRARRGWDEGSAPAELALVILLFVFVIYGIYQFSMGMYIWNSVTRAAQEGGRNAMIFSSVYQGTQSSCDTLWATYVEPMVQYGLPGNPSDYTYSYACTAGSPPTMTISISYTLMAGGQFGSNLTIPAIPLKGGIRVPLD